MKKWDKLAIVVFTFLLFTANEYKWFEKIDLILAGVAIYGGFIALEVLDISERITKILDKFKG